MSTIFEGKTESNERLRGLHVRAVRICTDAVSRVHPDRLSAETPCAGWDLRALLAHMATQDRGFAGAVRGSEDPGAWEVRVAADPVADYLAAAEEVTAAFAEPDVFERTVLLPEVSSEHRLPAATAIRFHLVDSVVHAWDVARSIGETIDPDREVAMMALEIAEAVPDGPFRSEPGAAFAPVVARADSGSLMDRVLRQLGRSPEWAPTSSRA
ncbi:TIGR03086 family metal-binding protein [Nocardia amikacinitolerans]|uniref:TIGR03086 family metal-binding protein n=1 Tax=Nocardia amikacinitolerans TaxID=756689 RepID=UPI0020A5EFEF|nr:TIGR03086 family metal-binding protein [Nocardia amikacinitolerans]